VTTSSTSSNGGTAVAIKSANDDALHIVSSAADGNSSFTYSSSTPHSKGDAWDSAPACRNSSTATFDASMRLWGWENNAPCAFKEDKAAAASTGPAKADAWDSAPPCKQADTSATKDDSGRLWAWENGASCAFKAPGDGGDAVWEVSACRIDKDVLLACCWHAAANHLVPMALRVSYFTCSMNARRLLLTCFLQLLCCSAPGCQALCCSRNC
jgi:hypothetical protein